GHTANIHRDCVLVPGSVNKTIIKYWLEGPKEGTTEVFFTDCRDVKNIKRAATDGEYIDCKNNGFSLIVAPNDGSYLLMLLFPPNGLALILFHI
nr:protein strictosidine synthase-like 12-like [Tanacetum cinerariifolium]